MQEQASSSGTPLILEMLAWGFSSNCAIAAAEAMAAQSLAVW